MSTPTFQLAEDLIDNLTASVSSTTASQTYTIGNFGSGLTYSNTAVTGTNTQHWFSNSTSSKIQLNGKGADIEVNGQSLIGMIEKIEERLNILHPNEKLEAEWEELKTLGDQYRQLEQQILEKQATWDRLKAMLPPEID
jgi:hypothetical protein